MAAKAKEPVEDQEVKTFSECPGAAFDGEPEAAIPDSLGAISPAGLRFVLHLPIEFEMAYRLDDVAMIFPFTTMPLELGLGDGPLRRRTLAAGSGLFMPARETFRARSLAPAEFLLVVAPETRARERVEQSGAGRNWVPKPIVDLIDPGVAALAREARRAMIADPVCDLAYLETLGDGLLSRFSCQLLGLDQTTEPKETLAPFTLRKVLSLIEEGLSDELRVQDLANAANLSRSHFTRAFHAATGEAPQEFIISRRIARARELLASSDKTVGEIAAAAGFSSQAHLSTAFKKRLGLSPAAYRAAFAAAPQTDNQRSATP